MAVVAFSLSLTSCDIVANERICGSTDNRTTAQLPTVDWAYTSDVNVYTRTYHLRKTVSGICSHEEISFYASVVNHKWSDVGVKGIVRYGATKGLNIDLSTIARGDDYYRQEGERAFNILDEYPVGTDGTVSFGVDVYFNTKFNESLDDAFFLAALSNLDVRLTYWKSPL